MRKWNFAFHCRNRIDFYNFWVKRASGVRWEGDLTETRIVFDGIRTYDFLIKTFYCFTPKVRRSNPIHDFFGEELENLEVLGSNPTCDNIIWPLATGSQKVPLRVTNYFSKAERVKPKADRAKGSNPQLFYITTNFYFLEKLWVRILCKTFFLPFSVPK